MRPNTSEEFWKGVKRGKGCWIWTRAKDKDGYGFFHYKGKMLRATRFLMGVILQRDIEGMEVCHTCDNPSCVRASHLFVGTTKDNAKDRDDKGRGPRGKKLSPEHVARVVASRLRNGKRWTEEMKAKVKGVKRSEETRERIRVAARARDPTTRKHSEETKRKIGLAHLGMKRSQTAISNMSKAQKARFHKGP